MSAQVNKESQQEYRSTLPLGVADTLRAIAELADVWDGEWQAEGFSGGRLALPVMAGLRRGWVSGQVHLEARDNEAKDNQTQVVFNVDTSQYHLQKAATVTLVMAAVVGLVTMVAPLFPALLSLVPIGIILSLGAWLFIVARLRNSGPEEFFEELAGAGQTDTGQAGIEHD